MSLRAVWLHEGAKILELKGRQTVSILQTKPPKTTLKGYHGPWAEVGKYWLC